MCHDVLYYSTVVMVVHTVVKLLSVVERTMPSCFVMRKVVILYINIDRSLKRCFSRVSHMTVKHFSEVDV